MLSKEVTQAPVAPRLRHGAPAPQRRRRRGVPRHAVSRGPARRDSYCSDWYCRSGSRVSAGALA